QLSSRQFFCSTAQWRAFAPALLSASFGSLGLYENPPQAAMVLPGTHWLQAFDTPSSISALQFSSLPLQSSGGGTFCAMMFTSAVLTALVSVSDTKMAWPVPPAAAIRLAAVFSAFVSPLSVRM